ncbi:MAG: hypothetical protein AB1345_03325 [Chloroflexota bacterium]
MKIKTILFDVCGVLGDARGTVPWKIKVAMEEASLCEKYGIGFTDLMKAYCSGGVDRLWVKHKVQPQDIEIYFSTWDKIPEYPPGMVKMYPEVPFVFNRIGAKGISISLLTRLTRDNVYNFLNEIKVRGYEGDIRSEIRVFFPETDDVRKNDRLFIEKVLVKAYRETSGQRVYIDDSLDRVANFKQLDDSLIAIGSARGFYSVEDLKTMFYRKENRSYSFENFEVESEAIEKGYSRLFDHVITNLHDLEGLIDKP